MGSTILTSHLRATYDAAVKMYGHGGSEHVQLVNALAVQAHRHVR